MSREKKKRKRKADEPGQARLRTAGNPPREAASESDRPLGETPDEARCIVVGVGASAGGLDASSALLAAMPANPGIALVLIQHLDPDRESLMAELLSRRTSLTVVLAEQAARIERDHVYVIPPNKFIQVRDGELQLLEPVRSRGLRMPIDFFFRSLAEQYRELAIGIVLSGTGSDGSFGLKEIKARGGLVMVQDPSSCEYDGMPRSALAAGVVDFVLPVSAMPKALLQYLRSSYLRSSDEARQPLIEESSDDYHSIIDLLRVHTNYDFRCYKQGTLIRRIQRRMGLRQSVGCSDYLALLRKSPSEVRQLFKDLLINVTAFFREPQAWQVLEDLVVAPLVARRRDDETIRVWVPGCATGEEAYSVAILFMDQIRKQGRRVGLQVFATDIDADAVRVARGGLYPASIALDVPAERLQAYFSEKGAGRLRAVKQLREHTVFAVQDLIGDPPFSNLDLICCRNVMIYMQSDVQQHLLSMFHFALAPEGALFLGASETLGKQSDSFTVLSKPWRLYRKHGKTDRRPAFSITSNDSRLERLRPRELEPGHGARVAGFELAHKALLDLFVPASVIVDRHFQIQYFHGPLRDYLELPQGQPTTDLTSICLDGLRSKVRSAVNQALKVGEAVEQLATRVRRGEQSARVLVTATPLATRSGEERHVVVSFRDEAAPTQDRGSQADDDPESGGLDEEGSAGDAVYLQLEQELQSLREDLQATIQDLESSNEELQSTNEELETSREELQSLNEELTAVNSQLEEKIVEVEETSDDLANLLSSTDLATLFLDTDFRIRRFTPAATELLRVIPTDVGRPVSDLSPRFNDPELYRDARKVLRRLAPVERRVRFQGTPSSKPEVDLPRWFIRRILPYRTGLDEIGGVVITFTDVTDLTNALDELSAREQQTAAVARLGRTALVAESMDQLFEAAIHDLSETLGTEYAKILEFDASRRVFLLRAGIGWKAGLVGQAVVPAGADSQAGYTLQAAEPVVVDDLRQERRFSGPALLTEHGVVSGISVVIGPIDRPWGVLGAHSTQRRSFDADDANFVQAVAYVLAEAIGRHASNQALLDREHRLRLVTDALPVLIAYCDRDLVYRYCNAAYKEWFGLEQRQVVGRHVEEVIGREAFASVRPNIERVLAGEHVSLELKIPYRRAGERDVHIDYIPHVSPEGGVLGYYAMVEDVSDRVRHRQMQAELAAIVEHSGDAIIGKDLEGRVTAWNRGAERMYGYTAEEMLGQPLSKITPLGHEREIIDVIERLQRGESIEHLETVRRTKSGKLIHVSLTASSIRDSSGQLTGVSAIGRDISERRERELALRESEQRFRLAKRAAGLGIYDYDVRADSIRWDETVRDIWGVGPDEPITYGVFMNGLHPDDRGSTQSAIDRSFDPRGDGHYFAEYRVRHRVTAEVRWIEAIGDVTFEGDEPVRLVGTVRDITEARMAREAIDRADRRKDEFLATLGHELRNPLAALTNSVECLRTGAAGCESEEERGQLYAIMERQAHHMTTLLNDLLDIGRITRGDVVLRPQRIRVAEQVQGALEVVWPETQAANHTIEVDVEPDGLTVVADPVRFEQVLVNLLSNATRYTPERGKISVRARERGSQLELTVTDTGVGLTTAEQSQVFEMFYKARKGSSGLGIGLSLVQSLVELHGGRVSCSSAGPGSGATLAITMPLEFQAPEGPAPSGRLEPSPELTQVRVLVVEDHEDSLVTLCQLLSRHCQVQPAKDGRTALAVARTFRPHVVLLDLALPDVSGFEVAEWVARSPGLEECVKIAVTGFGDLATAHSVAQADFRHHLTKPIDFDALIRILRRLQADGELSAMAE